MILAAGAAGYFGSQAAAVSVAIIGGLSSYGVWRVPNTTRPATGASSSAGNTFVSVLIVVAVVLATLFVLQHLHWI